MFKIFLIITILTLSCFGKEIKTMEELNEVKNAHSIGDEITLTINRNGNEKEFNIGICNFDTINPILTKNLEIQHITKLIYEPLINITEDFNVEPCIAEEWSKIDELTYIIKLNENKRY